MNDNDLISLDIWKGDWGLPSVDIDCLQILTYAKFSHIPIIVNITSNPFKTPNGHLPVLRHNNKILDDIREILKHFRSLNYNSDFTLNAKQCTEVAAYEILLKEKLYPALQFIWWIDERNHNDFIRPWYSKALPFPFNFYYPGSYERHAKDLIECLYPKEEEIKNIETAVYSEAQKCITLLSEKLGTSEFFCGTEATTLDAVVYSYLAPLLRAPLPNPALQNHLKACENLVKFISRITQRYFETEYQTYEKLKAEENEKKMKNSENEFPNQKRNQFLAGIFAALAMVGYAITSGLLEVSDEESLNMSEEYLYEDEDVNE